MTTDRTERFKELLDYMGNSWGWTRHGTARLLGERERLVRRWYAGDMFVPADVLAWTETVAAFYRALPKDAVSAIRGVVAFLFEDEQPELPMFPAIGDWLIQAGGLPWAEVSKWCRHIQAFHEANPPPVSPHRRPGTDRESLPDTSLA